MDEASDWLTLRLGLTGGATFADVADALGSGLLRAGLHIRSIGITGDSDSYVSTPPSHHLIPLPTAPALAAAGLAVVLPRRRR